MDVKLNFSKVNSAIEREAKKQLWGKSIKYPVSIAEQKLLFLLAKAFAQPAEKKSH